MSENIGFGNKQDKWTKRVTQLINWLNENKSPVLVEGSGIVLTPNEDGTITISLTEYSLEEKVVGSWVDGGLLYKKTIDCGGIPNASTKTIAHGISNLDFVVSISGSCSGYSPIKYYPIPLVQHSSSLTNYQVKVEVDETNITLSTAADLSPLNKSYVTLLYTKATN